MNARQQYKMAALQGILTTSGAPCLVVDDQDPKIFAETVGKLADAMIEEDNEHREGEVKEHKESDWIPWYGGKCPVDELSLVEVRFRSGHIRTAIAGVLDWSHADDYEDIVAYRVIE